MACDPSLLVRAQRERWMSTADVMMQCLHLALPTALPQPGHLVEACARGMASSTINGPIVTFDYTAAGIENDRWRPVVSKARGLAIDLECPAQPVLVWPTPMVADLRPGIPIPDKPPPYVQRKIDGILVARFYRNGEWRWTGRKGLNSVVERVARRWWLDAGMSDGIVGGDLVLYFELCDPELPVPTENAAPGLYLLDVINRVSGSGYEVPEVVELGEQFGIRTPPMYPWEGSLDPFAKFLESAGPEWEGFVFRWGHDVRARLVNETYALLWNLMEDPSPEAIVDIWLHHRDLQTWTDWIPADMHDAVQHVYSLLERTVTLLEGSGQLDPRQRAAHVVLASHKAQA